MHRAALALALAAVLGWPAGAPADPGGDTAPQTGAMAVEAAAGLAPGQQALAAAGVPWLWARPNPTRSVLVAVVDSGVGAHPSLAGRTDPQVSLAGLDGDDVGHGTAVASVIAGRGDSGVAGVCRACRVLPVRITAAGDRADSADVARGVDAAVTAGAEVINLSLAGDRRSPALAAAVARAQLAGAVVVAAAGNDGRGQPQWPAALPGVVSVSHLGGTDRLAYGGTRGAVLATRTCLPVAEIGDGVPGVGRACGSSIAAAVVSGSIAELLSQGHPDPVGALTRHAAPHPDADGRLRLAGLAPW